MTAFSKLVLSGSTTGKNIKIAATAIGSGTTIHTAHATALDEVWLWVTNTDTTDRKLTIGWGGTTDPDDLHEMTIRAESGPVCVIPGWILTNSLIVKAAAASANVLVAAGFVNRVT